MPLQETDTFLVNGTPKVYTSTVAYTSRGYAFNMVDTQLNFPQDPGWTELKGQVLFPGGFQALTYRTFQSDADGNDLGTAEGYLNTLSWKSGSDALDFMRITETNVDDWASSGYVTFIVNDLTQSRRVQGKNLFNSDLSSSIVLVNEASLSYQCKISDLKDKASDSRWMLVNRGSRSYRVKSSAVVEAFGGPAYKPALYGFTYDQMIVAASVGRTTGGTSSSTGGNDMYQSVLSNNGAFTNYSGDLDYWYQMNFTNDPDNNYKTASLPGRGYTFRPNTLVGTFTADTSGQTVRLYRSNRRIRRADIDGNGAPHRYSSGSYPHDRSDGRIGFGCIGWMPFGEHAYRGKRWVRTSNHKCIFQSGAYGDGTVTVTIPCSNTSLTSTGMAIFALTHDKSLQPTFLPNDVYVFQQYAGYGVTGKVAVMAETQLNYNGNLEVAMVDPNKTGQYNDGCPDLWICYWTTTYS